MKLDTERQRELLLEVLAKATWPGFLVGEAAQLIEAVGAADVAPPKDASITGGTRHNPK